jgi:hypothetical protein
MTELELLEDTIKYYSENTERRCKTISVCSYSPITVGKKDISEGCAIGRFLDKDFALQIDKNDDDDLFGNSSIEHILRIYESEKSEFPDWMLKMNPKFLTDIQDLHDVDYHWDILNKKGLTEKGIEFVNKIKNKLANNLY